MKRRQFITLLGGAAGAWPLAAHAQQPAMPVIGFMHPQSPDVTAEPLRGLRAGLKESGYSEGENVAIEYRWAEADYGRLPGLAADLVRGNVAILVATGGEPSALAAKAATSTIPIVFTVGGDPVRVGLVDSLNRPGGNATGVSLLTTLAEAKRLGLLNEVVPAAGVFGVLINPNFQAADAQLREVQEAGHALGRPIQIVNAGNDREVETAFAALGQRHAGALLVTADPFLTTRRDRIVRLAAQYKLPAIYELREFAEAGGLMTYGVSLKEAYRQAGIYTGQVLKGARPADLPVHQSIKFEFVINLKTARTLGIKFSDNVLSLADEVIE